MNPNILAQVLKGAWRKTPPAPEFSLSALLENTPDSIQSGVGGLAWWRLAHILAEPPLEFMLLYETYLDQALRIKVREHLIARVATTLKYAQIPFLIVKGWAAARLYAEPGLRPVGDLDIVVSPAAQQDAQNLLTKEVVENTVVEVHPGPDDLGYYARARVTFQVLYERAERVQVENNEVFIPSAEDHLILLCLHLLKHGGFRPLWLCDVSAALEARSPRFDWSRIRGVEPYNNWIRTTIGLAHQVLGADVHDTPFQEMAEHLPRWMVPALFKAWRLPTFDARARNEIPIASPKLIHFLDVFRTWGHEPIEATVRRQARFTRIPPYSHQFADWLARAIQYMDHKGNSLLGRQDKLRAAVAKIPHDPF